MSTRTSPACGMQGLLPPDTRWPDGRWRRRALTAEAMLHLLRAIALVRVARFASWRDSLGSMASDSDRSGDTANAQALLLAAHVEQAAMRLPLDSKCLPRAIALSAMLRKRRIAHTVVIAARPANMRESRDSLHAWVEQGGRTILGELRGPWIVSFRSQ